MTAEHPDLAELADLDAGLLDPARAAEVRAAAAADADSTAVLDALAATRAELAALPAPAVPPELAARWDAALEREAASAAGAAPGPRADPGPAPADPGPRRGTPPGRPGGTSRPGRTRSARRWRRPSVGAAAVLAALVVAGVVWNRPAAPPSVDRVNLAAVARAAVGATDAGDLSDPRRRAGCLRAVAPALVPDAMLLGGRRVELDGREGVLLVLATGRLGIFDVAVVDPGCGPGGGALLASMRIGG
jgi:hypothetical protein